MWLTNRIFLIVLAVFYASLTAITLLQKTWRVDLNLVLLADDRLLAGESLYRVTSDSQEHTKPPLGTIAFLPLQPVKRYWVERGWDVLILVSFFLLVTFWIKYAMPRLQIPKWKMILLTLAVTFNCWNSELRCGQFNAIALLAVLLAVFGRALWQGPAVAFLVWLKPTNIVFLPWIWRHCPNRKTLLIGALAYTAVLSTVLLGFLGPEKFVTLHREWLTAAPLSVEKHVARFDNFGLPSLLSPLTTSGQLSTILQVAALTLSVIIAYQVRSAWVALSWTCLVAAFFSPMAWMQNYVLMTPFVLNLWNDFFAARGSRRAWLGVSLAALFVGFQVYNPTLFNHPQFSFIFFFRPPAWAFLLAVVFRLLADVEETVPIKATA